MPPFNTESALAKAAEYFGWAYLPQLGFQAFENYLARSDIRKAVNAKCGSAGAVNGTELEKKLVDQFSPMTQWGRLPVSQMTSYRVPQVRQWIPGWAPLAATAAVGTGTYFLQDEKSSNTFSFSLTTYLSTSLISRRPMPFLAGPRNPFLLSFGAAGFVGDYMEKVYQAEQIQDPVKRKEALDAIGKSDLYWAAAFGGAAFTLADYNRGWGLASRLPVLRGWSALGSNSPYQQALKDLSGQIKCNSNSGPGGGEPVVEGASPEAAPMSVAAPEAAATPEAAVVPVAEPQDPSNPDQSPQAQQAQMCSVDFMPEAKAPVHAIPDSALIPLDRNRIALSTYRGSPARQGNPVTIQAMGQGAQVLHGNTVIAPVAPIQYTLAPIVAPVRGFVTSMARPIIVLEPAVMAK